MYCTPYPEIPSVFSVASRNAAVLEDASATVATMAIAAKSEESLLVCCVRLRPHCRCAAYAPLVVLVVVSVAAA